MKPNVIIRSSVVAGAMADLDVAESFTNLLKSKALQKAIDKWKLTDDEVQCLARIYSYEAD